MCLTYVPGAFLLENRKSSSITLDSVQSQSQAERKQQFTKSQKKKPPYVFLEFFSQYL